MGRPRGAKAINKREKILAAGAGLVAVAMVTYMAINRVFLLPAAQKANQAKDIQARIDRAMADRQKENVHAARLRELAALTFSGDEYRVSEEVRARITAVLGQSGLSAQNLSLKPLIGSRVPGVYRETGWLIRARGKLNQVVNFLYLMSREPHLHRLDNLVLTPVPGGTDVELQVKYATLVIEAPKGEKLETDRVADVFDADLLESPERAQYDLIASRDLFRPYIPASPRPREPASPAVASSRPSEPAAPRVPESRYRLVGLPDWGGRPDVLIRDSASGKVATFKPGDDLAGGKIVTVDYRPMPLPNKPEILSSSRVVLQIGTAYYAVELGASLAEKHPLSAEDLPPGLPPLSPPAEPGGAASEGPQARPAANGKGS